MPGKLLKEVLILLPEGVDREVFARSWALSSLELPAYGRETLEGGCKGVVKNNGLYTQCITLYLCIGKINFSFFEVIDLVTFVFSFLL